VLVVKRLLPAAPQKVFAAWTDPLVMARWFYAGTDWSAAVRNDLRVGGSYQVDMRTPEGQVHSQAGVYREILPCSRLSFTWTSELVRDSLVVLEFRARGRQTELVLAHHLPDDAGLVAMHESGWAGCLANLEAIAPGLSARRP
jgi:uncharacterized protein YndB with AHSA1/START domain